MIRSSQRRGRHKVFIGMAPGVGKTCRMLQEGYERLRDGSDVVIGLLETHGRRETARQAEGLEQVPRKRLRHRGVGLEELDVAAVLQRRPQLVLVDELAHSNAPGSERAKRWQDVEALLLSGLDVYSTLNIQHLESLNDRVAELTGVVVRERIPNRVLEQADQVVLVDVTPETLQERLLEGKVYAPGKVEQALAGYFQRANLIALRELSLREVADRVEEDAAATTLALRERVMVCLTTAPSAQRLRRRGARLAAALDAPLLVLTVLDSHRFLSGGGEPEGWSEPWRKQRRTPEGSVPPIKGSPPPRSAHQRRTPKGGEPGPDPWRGADHGGACGSGAHSELSESGGSEHPERLPSDTSDRRSSGLANSRSLPEKSP